MPKSLIDLPSWDYERLIDFMRADLESGMQLSKERDTIVSIAKKMFKEEGRDFDAEFKQWQKEGAPVFIPKNKEVVN